MADSPVRSLRDSVDAKIAGSNSAVLARVHDHYVETEIKRRADIIVAGVNAVREAEVDLRKIDRPDNTLFNGDGTVGQQFYTKGRLDEVKKAKERLIKVEAALGKVIDANPASPDDFKKLEEIIKKKGADKKPETTEEE